MLYIYAKYTYISAEKDTDARMNWVHTGYSLCKLHSAADANVAFGKPYIAPCPKDGHEINGPSGGMSIA